MGTKTQYRVRLERAGCSFPLRYFSTLDAARAFVRGTQDCGLEWPPMWADIAEREDQSHTWGRDSWVILESYDWERGAERRIVRRKSRAERDASMRQWFAGQCREIAGEVE